ncbi:hypothetical protein BC833DRAFT_431639 [Globomyces pollinis-pini]|nr:hypothetical protein BC833DRAFT_431639 [Globomyces pollinis-pini]
MELEEVKKVNVKKHLWRYTTPLFEIATAEVHDYVNNRDSKVDVQNASVELCVPDQLDTPDDKFSEDLKISVVEEENIEAPSPVDLQSINDIPSHQTLETDDQEVDEIQSNVANDLPDTNLVQPTEDVTLDTKLTIPVESEADDLQVDIDSNMVNAENCDDMNVEEKGLSLAVEMNEIEVEVLPPEQNVNQCDVDPSDSGEPAVDTDIIDQPMIEITDQNTGASEVEADPLEIDANNKVYPIEKSDFLEDIQHDIKSQISSR